MRKFLWVYRKDGCKPGSPLQVVLPTRDRGARMASCQYHKMLFLTFIVLVVYATISTASPLPHVPLPKMQDTSCPCEVPKDTESCSCNGNENDDVTSSSGEENPKIVRLWPACELAGFGLGFMKSLLCTSR
ncbi:uncharacterized protein LOC143031295 [Oratosquilla oratoria]|uniref:uncharacterized protein LOC143031295 n=1 Tax=Oratosquilla oratoria TaxID=337810 RepID=UPI003F7612B8